MRTLLASLVFAAILGAAEIKSGYVRTSDGVRLHYLEAGSGPALVFVPGWICPTWIWEPQIRRFSKQYRVVAMDPRSQGESDKVTEGHYPERRAQDIKELIEQLRLTPAVVVGHSMAVAELLAYVDQFGTSTLAGMVLADDSIGPPKPEEQSELFAFLRQFSTNRRQSTRQLAQQFFKKPQPPEFYDRLTEATMKTPTNTALALIAGGWGRDFRPALGKLDKPVLYAITPRLKEEGELLKTGAPRARVEVFENSGHTLFLDEPEKFNTLLEDFARSAFGAPSGAPAPNHAHYAKPAAYDQPAPSGAVAPRLQNVGDHKFPVTIKSEGAQLFINQGLNLVYGFNHAEAARAFAEAARVDPECPMAYWGQALALGPNINAPMNPADEPKAFELAQKAVSLKSKASPRERDYIDALAKRYTGKAEDRKSADRAFAEAMRELSRKYADDLDAATLFAESLMDLRPWNYWTRDGHPQPGIEEAAAAIQSVMKRNPKHPGALHYWIHLMESTKNPERAEEAADRLLPLAPAAGHLVHMPSHIYMRVGRYADAARANQLAVAADQDYITQCRAQGIYPLAYYPHNLHFLWSASTMEGRSQSAIEAARNAAAAIPQEALNNLPPLQGFLVVPYYALVRFGKWEEILKEPRPRHDTLYTEGVWRYARGAAFTATGKLEEAQKELDELRKITANPELAKIPLFQNRPPAILGIAEAALAGQLAAKRGELDQAILHLDRAVRLQDALTYTEPEDWHYPMRESLGAVLLQAGRAVEAEAVYWENLKKYPENGWSLFGLMQALKAQGKIGEAAQVEERFRKAWARADFSLGN